MSQQNSAVSIEPNAKKAEPKTEKPKSAAGSTRTSTKVSKSKEKAEAEVEPTKATKAVTRDPKPPKAADAKAKAPTDSNDQEDKRRPISARMGSPKASIKRPDTSKKKGKKKSRLPIARRKKNKNASLEAIMGTVQHLSDFMTRNAGFFDNVTPSAPAPPQEVPDDISSLERPALENLFMTMKASVTELERKLNRERERARNLPKLTANVPTSLEVY